MSECTKTITIVIEVQEGSTVKSVEVTIESDELNKPQITNVHES